MDNLNFNLPNKYEKSQLMAELADFYSMSQESSTREKLEFFDTFDWRLFNHSLILHRAGDDLFLSRLADNDLIQRLKSLGQPVFIEDFPEGSLKERLKPVMEMRALLKLAEVYVQSTGYRILNPDEKTVVRLVCQAVSAAPGEETAPLAVYVSVRPVRGYPRYARNLAKYLSELGCIPVKKGIYFEALEAAGKTPGDYSAKLNLQLSPDMPADEATKILLRTLLKVMKSNEAYLKKDIDTEFLHDFRVAVRRTRSALSQIKDVFPAETTNRFKADFAFIGKLSNELRDIDVYLLTEATYKAMLPDILQNDIEPLFDHLRTKRVQVLKHVIGGLESKEYGQIIQAWETFLNEPAAASPAAPQAGRPILDLAQERIYKRYRRIVKAGYQILEDTEDEKLHSLRIECKELRYLLEFFFSLFPPKEMTTLIKQLKKLQDNLGDFNDFCVQEEYLLNIANELPLTDGQQARKTLLAIGSLVDKLADERQQVKAAFAQTFRHFASPKNKKLFKKLFAVKKELAVS